MDDYISKPIDPRAFLATVRRWAMGRESDSRVASPVVAAPAATVLDESPVNYLAELLPRVEFDALIDAWLTSTAAGIDRVVTLAVAGDLAGLGFVAHDLVSTAGNFGARRLEDAARRLGRACKSGDVEAAESIAAELAEDGAAAIKAVADRFAPLAAATGPGA
jgi:HPt (histidine-containing phosphotransfer) domain-containing protein